MHGDDADKLVRIFLEPGVLEQRVRKAEDGVARRARDELHRFARSEFGELRSQLRSDSLLGR